MYTVMHRCYPSFDEDFCWEHDYDYMDTKAEAEKFARDLQESFSPKFCPPEHPYYNDKFYAWEVTEDYLKAQRASYANRMTAAEMGV